MKILISWFEGLIYPFREKDWKAKMWLIPLTSFLTPFFQLLVLSGWRVELVRRIGLKKENILPRADVPSIIKYALHGVKLHLITLVYLLIPIFIFALLGINPLRQIFIESSKMIGYLWGYLWGYTTETPLMTLLWNSFWVIVKELFIRNLWFLFYYPYYRAATMRYALTGKFRQSHLAIIPNITFVLRNAGFFLMMVVNEFIDKVIIFCLGILFIPLIPFLLFYADFWTSGYEHGQVAIKMVEQEYPEMLKSASPDEPPLSSYEDSYV